MRSSLSQSSGSYLRALEKVLSGISMLSGLSNSGLKKKHGLSNSGLKKKQGRTRLRFS